MSESSTDAAQMGMSTRRLLSGKWFAFFLLAGALLGFGVAISTWIANKPASTLPQAVLASSVPLASAAALIVGVDQVLRAANRRAASLGDSLQAQAYGEVRGLALLTPVAAAPAYAFTLLFTNLNGDTLWSLALGGGLIAALVLVGIAVSSGAHVAAARVSPEHAKTTLERLDEELTWARKGESHRKRVMQISQIQLDLDRLIRRKSTTESDWSALSKRIDDLRHQSIT